jgi:predicted O-methyltransferase YrrM
MSMSWSPESAANAYRDALKLSKIAKQRKYAIAGTEPHSTEFIAALAAGIEAKLIVEVSSCAGPSTIALAVAAQQTGGRLICILSNSQALLDAMVAMKELGLSRVVEFMIGDAEDILPQYEDVDFALIDCMKEHNVELFEVLRFNSTRAVVVADNLFDRKATAAYAKIIKNRPGARSITLPIGKGIEISRLEEDNGRSQQGRRLTKRVSWAMDLEKMYSNDCLQC